MLLPTTLTSLKMISCQLNDDHLKMLSNAFSLKKLEISMNPGVSGIYMTNMHLVLFLARNISGLTSLTKLNMSKCSLLSDKSVQNLHLNGMLSLDLSYCTNITCKGELGQIF